MESCAYKDENGRCNSRYEVREVEFAHPDYRNLNIRLVLCRGHFNQIFGELVAKKDSMLPLEKDQWLLLQVRNEEKRYRDKLEEVKKKVRNGIGDDYFDWDTFKASNRRKLELLKEELKTLRRGRCRYEWCNLKLTNFSRIYTIKIYPIKPTEYINLFFCSLDHWEVFKKRIGITETIKGKLKMAEQVASITLDSFKN